MTFTNLVYAEFDTTQQNLISDLLDNITASASWSKINSTTALVSTTASVAAGATVLTASSGAWASAGIGIGSVVRIGAKGAADTEYRTVTATAATTITVAALTYAHASGTNVYDGHEILKATTTRGADMIVDIMDSHISVAGLALPIACWRSHTGAMGGGTGRTGRFVPWRLTGTPTATNLIHCIVSASKEHLFISLEGPRYNEVNPESGTLGSSKSVFGISDLVPYFGGDTTPVATAVGKNLTGIASFPLDLYVNNTRDAANTVDWPQGRLLTLTNPSNGGAYSMNYMRQAAGDGNWYLAPYVVVEDTNGMRGRLAAFHFAGLVNPDGLDAGLVASPPIGSKVTYSGQLYKIVTCYKTGSNNALYGAFGGVTNNSNSANNVAIAVPCT